MADARGPRTAARLLVCLLALHLGACATTARSPGDPFEPVNRPLYRFNDSLDRALMVPMAKVYRAVTPAPLRTGVTNFFANLGYLNVIANDLLQGKPRWFMQDLGRLVVNSTIGIAGLFDPATGLGLVAHDEDLGQTLGVWGAGEGAYLVLPMVGPNSIRDVPDIAGRQALNLFNYMSVSLRWPLLLVELVNQRSELLDETEAMEVAAIDPYIYVREAYRQQRLYQIHDGNPPLLDLDEESATP
ncbi:MAG: VacJ family lipoprotein [Gammaproteobacteria bacterium]|nr:VacJ family lipoprotein [Gammaproteobacteria bacterium]